MDDRSYGRAIQSLNETLAELGTPVETLLGSATGRWYLLHVQQELQAAPPPDDLSMAISNTMELAAGLPAEQRREVQGIGIVHLLALSDEPETPTS